MNPWQGPFLIMTPKLHANSVNPAVHPSAELRVHEVHANLVFVFCFCVIDAYTEWQPERSRTDSTSASERPAGFQADSANELPSESPLGPLQGTPTLQSQSNDVDADVSSSASDNEESFLSALSDSAVSSVPSASDGNRTEQGLYSPAMASTDTVSAECDLNQASCGSEAHIHDELSSSIHS